MARAIEASMRTFQGRHHPGKTRTGEVQIRPEAPRVNDGDAFRLIGDGGAEQL